MYNKQFSVDSKESPNFKIIKTSNGFISSDDFRKENPKKYENVINRYKQIEEHFYKKAYKNKIRYTDITFEQMNHIIEYIKSNSGVLYMGTFYSKISADMCFYICGFKKNTSKMDFIYTNEYTWKYIKNNVFEFDENFYINTNKCIKFKDTFINFLICIFNIKIEKYYRHESYSHIKDFHKNIFIIRRFDNYNNEIFDATSGSWTAINFYHIFDVLLSCLNKDNKIMRYQFDIDNPYYLMNEFIIKDIKEIEINWNMFSLNYIKSV